LRRYPAAHRSDSTLLTIATSFLQLSVCPSDTIRGPAEGTHRRCAPLRASDAGLVNTVDVPNRSVTKPLMDSAQPSLSEQKHAKLFSRLRITSPFTIPSGAVTTAPSVIARFALEIPALGFLTTKTISLEPREGYREPVVHEYYPGCFINAVGLTNPGAQKFLEAMQPHLPLHDHKPLIVSIMGQDPQEFLACALILDPIADALELNLSCPHVKGAGQAIGSTPRPYGRCSGCCEHTSAHRSLPSFRPTSATFPAWPVSARKKAREASA